MDDPPRHDIITNVLRHSALQDFSDLGMSGNPFHHIDPGKFSAPQDYPNPDRFANPIHHSVPQDYINPGRFGDPLHHELLVDPIHCIRNTNNMEKTALVVAIKRNVMLLNL